jgi:hypothetical protein
MVAFASVEMARRKSNEAGGRAYPETELLDYDSAMIAMHAE